MSFDPRGLDSIPDGCSSEDLPEVELVGMLEEQLPDYKLRVDSLYLYENADWMQPVAAHGRLPEVAAPAREEDSFRYMSESGVTAPNTADKHLHTHLVLILGNGQIWKRLISGDVLVVHTAILMADLGCLMTA